MRLMKYFSFFLILLAVEVIAQSKDDEEKVDSTVQRGVEGSGNAPSDDEDTVEGSGLPPSQVYTKQTTIIHARPAVNVKPTTSIPEGIVPPKKKDPLPAIINMDLVEKEQREKQQEKEKQTVSIAPAIPRITTNRPNEASQLSNYVLGAVLGGMILLIIAVIIIILVCRRQHKSEYTPARQD
ncbi:hypothetical protein PRIPAC_97533 [Pristionchus pacificus]|uniref:Uncharacterized protein n=1 Tax=Pristionchus pacificus TaxID=54126 RepID=A0A454XRN3_PRIPA|nr:hypothetical protein PRIPAC_97533 [Pristionchus pacificus]|eukprot:PDM84219.1 hypothetical protein PRIPAC_33242 [Pristionchus pacificus]